MAIHIHCINVVIPIDKIKQCKVVGGFEGVLNAQKKNVLCDDYLYCESAMNQYDIENIIKFWEKQGLEPFMEKDGEQYWKDLCVVEMIKGPTLPCDWVEFKVDDSINNDINFLSYVFMKGKTKGKLVSLYESFCNKEI